MFNSFHAPAFIAIGLLAQAVTTYFHRVASPEESALADALLWFPFVCVPVLGFFAGARGSGPLEGASLGLLFAVNALLLGYLALPAWCGVTGGCLAYFGHWRTWWMEAIDWLLIGFLYAMLGAIGVMTARGLGRLVARRA